MMEKKKWYCSRCDRFVDNPDPSGIAHGGRFPFLAKAGGIPGQMSCDICGHSLMEITGEGDKKWQLKKLL